MGTTNITLLDKEYVLYMPINICRKLYDKALHDIDGRSYISGKPKLKDPKDISKGWVSCVSSLPNKDEIIAEVNETFLDDCPAEGIVEFHTRIPKEDVINIFKEVFEVV